MVAVLATGRPEINHQSLSLLREEGSRSCPTAIVCRGTQVHSFQYRGIPKRNASNMNNEEEIGRAMLRLTKKEYRYSLANTNEPKATTANGKCNNPRNSDPSSDSCGEHFATTASKGASAESSLKGGLATMGEKANGNTNLELVFSQFFLLKHSRQHTNCRQC